MSRLFSSIVFSFFLFFQTTSIAEENATSIDASVEEMEVQEAEVPVEVEYTEPKDEEEPQTKAREEVQEEVKPEEALSDAEKEARAAEEAELREAGVYEEPVVE